MSTSNILRLFAPDVYILLSVLILRIFDFDPGSKRTECWSAEEWAVVGVSAFGVLLGIIAKGYALLRFRNTLRCGCRCRDDGQEAHTSLYTHIIVTVLAVITALSHAFTYLINTAPAAGVDCANAVVPMGPVVGSIAMTLLFGLATFAIINTGRAYQRLDSSFGEQELGVASGHGVRDGPTVHFAGGHNTPQAGEEEDEELEMRGEEL